MSHKKDSNNLLLLLLAGVGIWWLYRKYGTQSTATVVATNVAPSTPYTDLQGTNVDPSLNTSSLTGQTVPVNADHSALVKWQLNGIGKKLGKIPNTI